MISWSSYSDKGSPKFIQTDEELGIVCAPGDQGRWLGSYLEPFAAGDALTIFTQAKISAPDDVCATLLLTWWKNEPGMVFHSAETFGEVCGQSGDYKQFEHDFIVPQGVKMLRVDLRAWSGAGNCSFKDIHIEPKEEVDPPKPPEPPEPPEPPKPPDYMLTIALDLETVIWRITASVDSVTALRIDKEEYDERSPIGEIR